MFEDEMPPPSAFDDQPVDGFVIIIHVTLPKPYPKDLVAAMGMTTSQNLQEHFQVAVNDPRMSEVDTAAGVRWAIGFHNDGAMTPPEEE